MVKPWQQGHFDGMCGIYALINSVHVLSRGMNEAACTKLFQFLVETGGSEFPKAIYDGLDFEPLCGIATRMCAHLSDSIRLTATMPFRGAVEATSDTYFDHLQSELIGRKAVAIVGLGQPWDHWTVVTQVMPHSLRFADSYGIKRFNRAVFSLEEMPNKIKIDFQETIIIERTPSLLSPIARFVK